jgi:hypothetical protein
VTRQHASCADQSAWCADKLHNVDVRLTAWDLGLVQMHDAQAAGGWVYVHADEAEQANAASVVCRALGFARAKVFGRAAPAGKLDGRFSATKSLNCSAAAVASGKISVRSLLRPLAQPALGASRPAVSHAPARARLRRRRLQALARRVRRAHQQARGCGRRPAAVQSQRAAQRRRRQEPARLRDRLPERRARRCAHARHRRGHGSLRDRGRQRDAHPLGRRLQRRLPGVRRDPHGTPEFARVYKERLPGRDLLTQAELNALKKRNVIDSFIAAHGGTTSFEEQLEAHMAHMAAAAAAGGSGASAQQASHWSWD